MKYLCVEVRPQSRDRKIAYIGNSLADSEESLVEITSQEKSIPLFKISLTSSPVDGKANKELIKALSKWLTIPQSQILLVRGESARLKLLQIEKLDLKSVIVQLRTHCS